MRRRGRVCVVMAAVVFASTVMVVGAAQPSLEVQLSPRQLGVEDTARLVVIIREPGRRNLTPNLGSLDNFLVVAGPSTENRFMFVNGSATTELAVTYVLQPRAVGAARVGPVTVQVGAETLRSEPLDADVVAGSLAPRRPQRRNPFSRNDPMMELVQQQQRPSNQAKIMLRQLVDKREIFLGQPITVTLALDTNISGIEGYEWVTAPSFPGWWTQAVEQPEEVKAAVVDVAGERYQRYLVGQYVLVPLKAGELLLPSTKARIGVRQRSFFSRQQVVERATDEIRIEVLERPQPPEGYSGAVGDLHYRVEVEPSSLELGQSAVVSIILDGSGNLPLVDMPVLWPSCADCDTYPPEDEIDLKVDAQGMSGTRIWRQTILPRTAGELRLDPVTLAVFDPVAGHYRRQAIGPSVLSVEAPPPTPVPTKLVSVSHDVGPKQVDGSSNGGGERSNDLVRIWPWLAGSVCLGVLFGGVLMWLVVGRRPAVLPPRRAGQSPAERAKELQMALERWWMEVKASSAGAELEPAVDGLRRELETVRFAPGRADHTETIGQLEGRVSDLVRRKR